MQSKDLLKSNLKMSVEMTLPLIEDMHDAPLTFPTSRGGNHPLWVLGHIAFSEGVIVQEFMLAKPNPLAEWKEMFDTGTEPTGDASFYPSFDEVMSKCKEIHQANLTLLDSLSEEDLDTKSKGCPEEIVEFCGTYRLCYQMLASHWLLHYGQIADARRMDGRKRLIA